MARIVRLPEIQGHWTRPWCLHCACT